MGKKEKNPSIPDISKQEVEKWLKEWNDNPEYTEPEKAMDILFDNWKGNTNLNEVLTKCTLVNYFYGTNIYKIYYVAKHIVDMKIDERLEKSDLGFVNELAAVTVKDSNGKEKKINFYSFASKYCSRHKPDVYPIYDSYVVKVLKYYRDIGKFKAKFTDNELRTNYSMFKELLLSFKEQYNLEGYSLKQLDMFLWQFGKKYFPNKY